MASVPPSRWSRAETIVDRALDLPPEQRAAWLREACGGDTALLRAVQDVGSPGTELEFAL